MESIKLSYAERNLCSRRREALLYIAGRFMAVHIDLCGRRKRAREQAASEQALKLGPGFKLQGGWARKATGSKLPYRGTWIKFRGARIGRLD